MVYCKKFIILFLILFLLFFNISFVFASHLEEVDRNLSLVSISPDRNYFIPDDINTSYIPMEVGYKYTIVFDDDGTSLAPKYVAVSNQVPANNVTYTYLGELPMGTSYSYIPTSNSYFLCCFRNNHNLLHFYREEIDNQESAISDLVDNVGPNALWGVFGSGIDFVFVVVLVAFGIFIIVKLIKGLSNGKFKI